MTDKEQIHDRHDYDLWGDTELKPAPKYDGNKAVYSHVTHSILGDAISEGETLVVMFRDCAIECEVTAKHTDDD